MWTVLLFAFFRDGIEPEDYPVFRNLTIQKKSYMLQFLRVAHEHITGRRPSAYE